MGDLERKATQRDHARLLSQLQQADAYRIVREGAGTAPIFQRNTASGLINAAGDGDVLGVGTDLENATGRPIWDGAMCLCWMDFVQPLIIASNATTVLAAAYVSGTKTLVASYTNWGKANGGFFAATGLNDTNFEILDPSGILPGISADDIVLFETGIGTTKPNSLTVIELIASGTASGGGTLPWPDFPTVPDPTTGTTTVRMFRALVNATAGIASTDATLDFDGGTEQVGEEETSGTAVNKRPAAFVDNEPVEIIGAPGGTFYALKIGGNRIVAQVDGTPSGGFFNLKNPTALEGPLPHTSQRVAKVLSGQTWNDNDWGLFELDDDKKWSGVKLLESGTQVRMGLLVADIPAASSITYSGGTTASVTPGTQADAVLLLQGDPANLTGELLCVGVNYSKQARKGDATHPVVVLGKYFPAEGETPAKFAPDPQDLRQQNEWALDSDQSIGHDADGQPLWQDDEACPEPEEEE